MHNPTVTVDYNPNLAKLTRKKRVCAYARVSSEKEEAFHSLSAQISYYQTMIAEHPDWEFVEVFADRGITGTKETREGFQRMLTACREGKVDIVLTKSISRFARNTVILLETIRELKSLGVDIHFEEERINTLSETGEFMISILAARAQEESRSASENQLWRIRKNYENGIPVTGNCMGYRMVNHEFLIDDEEEQIILRIFSMYLSGLGKTAIAKQLNAEGITNRLGKKISPSGVRHILSNEKYIGDLLLQKSYRINHISKKNVKNTGQRPLYRVNNAHDAIVDRESFDKVQVELARRVKKFCPHASQQRYPFSSMIECQNCEKHFVRKTLRPNTKYASYAWSCCISNKIGKDYCSMSQPIPEKILTEITCQILGLESLEYVDLKTYLQKIIVPEKNTLIYVFIDGTEKVVNWQHHSRRESWTPEMKERARQLAIEQHKNQKKKKEEEYNGS